VKYRPNDPKYFRAGLPLLKATPTATYTNPPKLMENLSLSFLSNFFNVLDAYQNGQIVILTKDNFDV
jgi:hypothetical protein